MKGSLLPIALLAFVSACQNVSPETADLVIEHAAVVDVRDGTVLSDQTIFVEGSRVVAIAPSSRSPSPPGARVVDGSGRFVIPGLWDSHVHSAASTSWHFPILVAHGVTGVRNMHSTVDDALGLTNSIKRELASGNLIGPRFLANGPILDGSPATWPGAVVVDDEAGARAAVDSLADEGADFIKVYDGLDRDVYLALMDQARTRGIPVDGHMPVAVPPVEAASAGQRTVEHLSGITMGCSAEAGVVRQEYAELQQNPLPFPEDQVAYFGLIRKASDGHDPTICEGTVQAYLDAGVAVVPTLINAWTMSHARAAVADSGAMSVLPTRLREEWSFMANSGPGEMFSAIMEPVYDRSVENLRMLHAAGVPVLAGTDVGNPFIIPGRHLQDELVSLVNAGLSPLEAIRSATSTPARVFGISDSIGVVLEGYVADLVLLEANPLEDIENVRRLSGVVLNGRYFDRAALDDLIAGAAGR